MKRISIIKRLFFIALIFLLSINTFAVAVSDNDGAAFITKGEFDSLRNQFQSQIDTYNTQIDAKIDVAIATYLGGLDLATETQVAIPLADWKLVTAMSKALYPRFEYPGVNLSIALAGTFYQDPGWYQTHWAIANLKRNQYNADYKSSTRPCIKGINENEAGTANKYATWDGVYCNWTELINGFMLGRSDSNFYAIEAPATNVFCMYHALQFNDKGYIADTNSYANQYWDAGWSYYSDFNGHGFDNFGLGTIKSRQLAFSIDTRKTTDTEEATAGVNTINDQSRKYTHIVHWQSVDNEVYSKDFQHTLRKSDKDTLSSNDWINLTTGNAWTKEQTASIAKIRIDGAGCYCDCQGYVPVSIGNYNYNQGANTQTYIPRIGLAKTKWPSLYIYQDENPVTQVVDRTPIASARVNLCGGFPLLAAKKGDIIKWKPHFNKFRCSDLVTPTNTNLCIVLSTQPFSSQTTTTGSLINFNYTNSAGTYVNRTEARTRVNNATDKEPVCDIEWTMPQDGFVYVKWYPDLTTSHIDSYTWEADLNLEKCGSYMRKPATN